MFTLTSFVTLATIWAAATLTDRLVDRPTEAAHAPRHADPHPHDPERSASYARP